MYTTIACVIDLSFCGDYLLIVATSSLTDQGILNIFSVGLRKVIQAIEIPQRVTAMDVVFTNINEDVPEWILSKHLHFFSGLVAVGTVAGYIYLVDLCLDELAVSHGTETVPKKLSVIGPGIIDPKEKRDQAKLYDRHLAMLLDDQCHRQGQFYYRRQDDTIQKILDEDTVTVTSIKYLSQAGTLAVGFNFGSFQLWRLYNPVLDYSSRFSPDDVAVSHFVVQEPENDPRNFVYLWVGHDDSSGDSLSSICLYQLCFARKNIYPSFGMFYDELESVCSRLNHKLTIDPYSSDTITRSSSIVSCYTIVNPYYTPPSMLSESFEEGLHNNDLSLSIFVWRAEGKRASSGTKYWMCIFDLNRWYHAQMPHTLRCHGNSLQVCSYWVACNLDEVIDLTSSSTSLLGVGISGDKVLRFINNSSLPPEEHSYPSALQLTSIQFITSDSCIRARCDGWQGQLLCQLAQHGSQILVQPADFYHQCHRARLLPQNYEELKTNSIDYQRTVLLNMALEHGITSTLVPQCIQQWADGEFTEQGCSLSFLLNWAWNRVISIKQTWDVTCEMLYDWSGHHVDSRTDWQLESLTQSLSNMKQIFSSLIAQSSPTTERGEVEMELRQDVVSILLLHFNVVRWCVSFSLLPEIDEISDALPGLFPFPINSLREKYTKKRAELCSMKGIVKDLNLLLIDDFLDCQGSHIKKMWKTLGGNGLYPPPSMQAVANMYLIEEVSTEVKHAVTLYLLQDLAALTKNESGEAIIASFIQRFMLSPGLVHQVQGLWFIDHRDFEEGVRHLVNPNIHEHLGGSWKHVAVVNTLLAQSEGKAATRYLHTKGALGGSPQEQQLYISVLLNNRHVSQALEYMRGCQNEVNSVQLMDHLVNECRNYKLLGQLLQLSLTDSEEVYLEQYLRRRAEPYALEPLLLYYLHHSRFLQAFQLNEDIKKMDRLETSLVAQERAATRNHLMEAYLKALPDVTRKLLMEKQRGSISSAKRVEVQRPKPLSTRVHKSDHIAMSRSHFVMAVLEKVTEAQNMVAAEMADVNDIAQDVTESMSNVPFLSTPRTPRHKMYSKASEMIYPDQKMSPCATNPLSSVKRRTLLESKDGQLNENIGLRQLTDECLQLLQTPVRYHKRKSEGLGLVTAIAHMKTPQSILKVQRLSKTLLSSCKDKSSSRRSSRSRSTQLGFSTGNSLQTSPVEKLPPSTPHLVSAESTAVKHLRFAGLSPSPASSPTVVSADTSQGIIENEGTSSSWQPGVKSAEILNSCREFLSREATITDPLSLDEDFHCVPDSDTVPERNSVESTDNDVLHSEPEHQSLNEGPDDRCSNDLEDLIRPDLQSEWKQGQLLSHTEYSTLVPSLATSLVSSVERPSVPRFSEEEDMEVVVRNQRSRESHSATRTHVVEKVTSSQSLGNLSSSYTQEVVKSTTRYVQLSGDADLLLRDDPSSIKRLSSRRDLSPLLVTSSHSLRFQKSSSVSPKSLKADVSEMPSGGQISPPATPPSSKRARILEYRAKEVGSVRKAIQLTNSPESDDLRRRKTPQRNSPSRNSPSRKPEQEEVKRQTRGKSPVRKLQNLEDRVDEDTQRKTSERKSRNLKKFEENTADEEMERQTPERKSPSRNLRNLEESTAGEETERKTLKRKSPSRNLRKSEESTADEEMERKTPERKLPSRNLRNLEESTAGEETERKTLKRKSPSRNLRKSEESTADEEMERKTPERKSPSRNLRNLEESTAGEETERKTLKRKSPSRNLRKSEESTADEEMERKTPERKLPSRNLRNLEESTAGKEIERKTPERKSPSRNLRKSEESTADEEIERKTPERKLPSRNLRNLEESTAGKEIERKTPERKSPSRNLRKSEESTADEEIERKTPERKLPSRNLRKLEEEEPKKDMDALGKHVPSPRSQRKTPERRSVTRTISKFSESDDKQIIREEQEVTKIPSYRNHRQTSNSRTTEDEDTRVGRASGADQVLGSVSEADTPPEVQRTRRSARLNTPDRVTAEGLGLEPAGGRDKTRKTPLKVTHKQSDAQEKVGVEVKASPSRKSAIKKISESSEAITNSEVPAIEPSHGQIIGDSRSPGRPRKKQNNDQEEVDEKQVHNLRQSRRQSRTPDRLVANMDVIAPLTPTRRMNRLLKSSVPHDILAESVQTSLKPLKEVDIEQTSSKQQELSATLNDSAETPVTDTEQLKSKPSTEEVEPVSVSQNRSVQVMNTGDESELTTSQSRRSSKEELEEPARRSLGRKTPDRQLREPDSEQVQAEVAESIIPGAKSPGRSRKSPARQTRSPARQTNTTSLHTSSNANNIKSKDKESNSEKVENNGEANDGGWSEEMPALRLEMDDVNDDMDNDHLDVADITKTRTVGRQSKTPDKLLYDHKTGPSSTTSEDPLIPSSQSGQLTTAAKKSRHSKDVTSAAHTYVFSPPLKHAVHAPDHEKHSLIKADEGKVHKQLFVFSQPTVAVDSDSSKHVDIVEMKSESRAKVEEAVKLKSKKKRTLLSYSPILLSPRSPVSVRRSRRQLSDSLQSVVRTKLRAPVQEESNHPHGHSQQLQDSEK